MKIALAIALGGALGSVGRYYVMGAAERWLASLIGTGFPYGTLTVNVVGSCILGALVHGLRGRVRRGRGGAAIPLRRPARRLHHLLRLLGGQHWPPGAGRGRPGAALYRALGGALGRRVLLRAQAGAGRRLMAGVATLEIAPEDGDQRLDRWFRRHYPALGHGRLEKLLRTGQIRGERQACPRRHPPCARRPGACAAIARSERRPRAAQTRPASRSSWRRDDAGGRHLPR